MAGDTSSVKTPDGGSGAAARQIAILMLLAAVAGLGVWYWGKGTFWSATLQPEDDESNSSKR